MQKQTLLKYCAPLSCILLAGISATLFETHILSTAKIVAFFREVQGRTQDERYSRHYIGHGLNQPFIHHFKRIKHKLFFEKSDSRRTFAIHVLADGLFSPDAIAVPPANGDIYFSQEEKGAIGKLEESNSVRPVIDENTLIDGYDQKPLSSPLGIAVDNKSRLYVVENCSAGRVLCFDLAATNSITGKTLHIPTAVRSFAWQDIAVSQDGSIALVGSKRFNIAGIPADLSITTLLIYSPANQVWLLYRELAEQFCSVCFSESGDTIVIGCMKKSRIKWFQNNAEQFMSGYSERLDSPPRACSIMPDGTLLVSQENDSLSSVNPKENTHRAILKAMPAPRFMQWDRHKERLILIAESSGEILRLTPTQRYHKDLNAISYARYFSAYKPSRLTGEKREKITWLNSQMNGASSEIHNPDLLPTSANEPFMTADFKIMSCRGNVPSEETRPDYLQLNLYFVGISTNFMTDINQAPSLTSTFKMRSGTIIQDTCTAPRCILYNLLDNSRKELSFIDLDEELNEVKASPWNIIQLSFQNNELNAKLHLLWDPVNPRHSCLYVVPATGDPYWGCLQIPETSVPHTHWNHIFTSSNAGNWISMRPE